MHCWLFFIIMLWLLYWCQWYGIDMITPLILLLYCLYDCYIRIIFDCSIRILFDCCIFYLIALFFVWLLCFLSGRSILYLILLFYSMFDCSIRILFDCSIRILFDSCIFCLNALFSTWMLCFLSGCSIIYLMIASLTGMLLGSSLVSIILLFCFDWFYAKFIVVWK